MPGTANDNIVEISNNFLPMNFFRIIRNAISIPSIAVIGVETVAKISEFLIETNPKVNTYLKLSSVSV